MSDIPDNATISRKLLKTIRATPAEARLNVLMRPEVIRALTPPFAARLRREAEWTITRARRRACSAPWADVEIAGGTCAVPGMVPGSLARWGEDGRLQHRWVPPHAAELETFLDKMTPAEADRHTHAYPPSPSAAVIAFIRLRGGKPINRVRSAGTNS